MGEERLKAPFPWWGGKSKVAADVWKAFGDVGNYIEPFFGSGAVLLGRPHAPNAETVNDIDGFICNFWRAVQAEPDAVAHYADWPVNENDLTARHHWLSQQREMLTARLDGDFRYYDPMIAGFWVWGISLWIGAGFCSGAGPWHSVNGVMQHSKDMPGCGIRRGLPIIDCRGTGINQGIVINRKSPHVARPGRGVISPEVNGIRKQLPHLSCTGRSVVSPEVKNLEAFMQRLSERLRQVRVTCGDWTRVLSSAATGVATITGVFLDPPYSHDVRDSKVYNTDNNVADAVWQWAIENGDRKDLRIALCGYEGEHKIPESWSCLGWRTHGGMSRTGTKAYENRSKERIWFSPHCLDWDKDTLSLFGD